VQAIHSACYHLRRRGLLCGGRYGGGDGVRSENAMTSHERSSNRVDIIRDNFSIVGVLLRSELRRMLAIVVERTRFVPGTPAANLGAAGIANASVSFDHHRAKDKCRSFDFTS
jgi:hypothetical protein